MGFTEEYNFFDITPPKAINFLPFEFGFDISNLRKTLIEIVYYVHHKEMNHSRHSYALFDLFGDFGGLMEIFFIIGGLVTSKYAEHSFLLKAFRKLYFARTKHKDIFSKSPKTKVIPRDKKQN